MNAGRSVTATNTPAASTHDPASLRILWESNAPWAPTGYGNQTRLFLHRLRRLGHEVALHSYWGHDGGIMQWEGIPCYPRGFTPVGQDVTGAHADHFDADIIITLFDAWAAEPQLYGDHAKWVPWFPVDSEPFPELVLDKVRHAWQPLVYSRFGERMAQQAGLDVIYVPHGIDTSVFAPRETTEARAMIGLPDDRFIVGMVAINKDFPSRKSLPQCIEAFAELHRAHPDALLFLHTGPTGEGGKGQGIDLLRLVRHLGISDHVVFVDQYLRLLGLKDDFMANLFSSFDVLLSPSMGEGFGIPIVEAQACGKPVILGDWTAMSELLFSGWPIAKTRAERFWMPTGAYQFLPHTGAIVDALREAYDHANDSALAERARAGAAAYDAELVTELFWRPALSAMADGLAREKERNGARSYAGCGMAVVAPGPATPKAALLLSLLTGAPDTRTIVEIGCARSMTEEPGDGWSTVHLAGAAKERGGVLYSVDFAASSIAVASKLLADRNLGVFARFIVGQGEQFLTRFDQPIGLLYLDGGDDPGETLAQFEAALPKLTGASIIVVDDCNPHGGNDFGKGTALIPRARSLGWGIELVPTTGRYISAVLRAGSENGPTFSESR